LSESIVADQLDLSSERVKATDGKLLLLLAVTFSQEQKVEADGSE
jgi:hypothetical protein